MRLVTEGRSYHSPLRAAQTERTRQLILDALAEIVAEDGFEGIVVRELAKRAGLAERTVYRHFPDRDALHDALAEEMAERGGWVDDSERLGPPERWPEALSTVFARFEEDAVATTVVARLNSVRGRPSTESARRRQAFATNLRERYPDLADDQIESLLALLQIIGSSRTWLRLKEELNMSGDRSGPVFSWLWSLVLAEIERGGDVPGADG